MGGLVCWPSPFSRPVAADEFLASQRQELCGTMTIRTEALGLLGPLCFVPFMRMSCSQKAGFDPSRTVQRANEPDQVLVRSLDS